MRARSGYGGINTSRHRRVYLLFDSLENLPVQQSTEMQTLVAFPSGWRISSVSTSFLLEKRGKMPPDHIGNSLISRIRSFLEDTYCCFMDQGTTCSDFVPIPVAV